MVVDQGFANPLKHPDSAKSIDYLNSLRNVHIETADFGKSNPVKNEKGIQHAKSLLSMGKKLLRAARILIGYR